MAEIIKTKPTGRSVDEFLGAIKDEGVREMLEKLGKISCGKSCLYIRWLSDIHVPTLQKLVTASVQRLAAKAKES